LLISIFTFSFAEKIHHDVWKRLFTLSNDKLYYYYPTNQILEAQDRYILLYAEGLAYHSNYVVLELSKEGELITKKQIGLYPFKKIEISYLEKDESDGSYFIAGHVDFTDINSGG